MKKIYTKFSYKSIKICTEKNEVIGEILHNIIAGYKEKFRINNQLYRIKNTGFLWNEREVYDVNNNLIAKTDSSKNRIIYYGEFTEFFNYKYKGWFSNKSFLYKDEQLLLTTESKNCFFKCKNMIEVDENFENYLIILFFLNLNLFNSNY